MQVFRTKIPALLSLLLVLLQCVPPVSAQERKLAPDFTLTDSKGDKRSLSDSRGQVVILNFWATWCQPCRAEIPWLMEIHKQYEECGLAVVGVAMDERGWRAVTPFLTEYGVNYPALLGNAKVARQYGGLDVLPQTVFVDRSGRIVATHNAILGKAQLDKIVEVLLAEPAPLPE